MAADGYRCLRPCDESINSAHTPDGQRLSVSMDKRTLMMVAMIAGTAVSATALILGIMDVSKHTGMICGAVGGAVAAVVVTFSNRNQSNGK